MSSVDILVATSHLAAAAPQSKRLAAFIQRDHGTVGEQLHCDTRPLTSSYAVAMPYSPFSSLRLMMPCTSTMASSRGPLPVQFSVAARESQKGEVLSSWVNVALY